MTMHHNVRNPFWSTAQNKGDKFKSSICSLWESLAQSCGRSCSGGIFRNLINFSYFFSSVFTYVTSCLARTYRGRHMMECTSRICESSTLRHWRNSECIRRTLWSKWKCWYTWRFRRDSTCFFAVLFTLLEGFKSLIISSKKVCHWRTGPRRWKHL